MYSKNLNSAAISLALYIHIPWCVKKCPYCDFNSHTLPEHTPFDAYVDALIDDARLQALFVQNRPIRSVFIGGGTPSLLPAALYRRLFAALRQLFVFAKDCEISLEANPATLEHAPFEDYLAVGINRLSIGVQSFDDKALGVLGRIHNSNQAKLAIKQARQAGFQRINVDIMHGLPNQSSNQALDDIATAVQAGATHLSWYQLTIEPNTIFYRNRPILPNEETLAQIEEQGYRLLHQAGFDNYEISAWVSGGDTPCVHNLNYWQFGDYVAIGAGAHAKVSLDEQTAYQLQDGFAMAAGIYRYSKSRLPKDYLAYQNDCKKSGIEIQQSAPKMVQLQRIGGEELVGEYMMNALRLKAGTTRQNFEQNTGLQAKCLNDTVNRLIQTGLLRDEVDKIVASERGYRYVNYLVQQFL